MNDVFERLGPALGDRYLLEREIGAGGMATVYLARDVRHRRRVALKVISEGSASSEANARLVREARAAAALDHPNAVAIFDVGELDGAPYIVMELIEGRTLRPAEGNAAPPIPTRSCGTWATWSSCPGWSTPTRISN